MIVGMIPGVGEAPIEERTTMMRRTSTYSPAAPLPTREARRGCGRDGTHKSVCGTGTAWPLALPLPYGDGNVTLPRLVTLP